MTRLCVSVEFSLQKSNEMEVEYTLRGWTREGKKKTRRTSRDQRRGDENGGKTKTLNGFHSMALYFTCYGFI